MHVLESKFSHDLVLKPTMELVSPPNKSWTFSALCAVVTSSFYFIRYYIFANLTASWPVYNFQEFRNSIGVSGLDIRGGEGRCP